jgi:hypothetical protein
MSLAILALEAWERVIDSSVDLFFVGKEVVLREGEE